MASFHAGVHVSDQDLGVSPASEEDAFDNAEQGPLGVWPVCDVLVYVDNVDPVSQFCDCVYPQDSALPSFLVSVTVTTPISLLRFCEIKVVSI